MGEKVSGEEAARYFRREGVTNLAEARALLDLAQNASAEIEALKQQRERLLEEAYGLVGEALETVEDAERAEFAADVIEDIEDLPDTPHESGE